MGYDFAVVGRGLMGTACARYLAEDGYAVALIGPDEPADHTRHKGPFGSFHDAGRITRRVATDPVWANLAQRSIARYAAIAEDSGIPFYRACGSVMAGGPSELGEDFIARAAKTSAQLDLGCSAMAGAELTSALSVFSFQTGTRAVLDPLGGVIDPRAMRRAEETLAERAGARVIKDSAVALQGSDVTLERGPSVSCGHVVIATGAYAATTPLTPPPRMRVYARTVLFAEVTEAEVRRLEQMPSLVIWPAGLDHDLYLLPPIRYPDGRFYIKIGGEGDSPRLKDARGIRAWFQSAGSAVVGRVLLDQLQALMPDLGIQATRTGSCAVSFTETGYPVIARAADRVTVLTGGNGAGAKCADELGRLGALRASGGSLAGTEGPKLFEADLVG
jgi:sarcosine oxidase